MCCAWEYLKYVVTTAAILGRLESFMRLPSNIRNYRPAATTAVALTGLAVVALVAQTTSAPAISTRARNLHERSLVFDAHVHAVDREFYHGGDIGERKPDGQFDLIRAREGG